MLAIFLPISMSFTLDFVFEKKIDAMCLHSSHPFRKLRGKPNRDPTKQCAGILLLSWDNFRWGVLVSSVYQSLKAVE